MRRPLLLSAVFAGVLVPCTSAAAAPAVFRPVADGYVDAAHPGRSHGRDPRLLAQGSRPVRRAFLRFNAELPAGRVLTRATLRLYARSAGGTAGVSLYSARQRAWRERGLTWRRQPHLGEHAVARASGYARGRWVSLDATALVLRGGHVTMAITSEGRRARSFASRESRHRPRLVVETAPSAGTGPGTGPGDSPGSPRYGVRGVYDRDFSPTGFDDEAAIGFNFIDSSPNRDQMDALAARGLKGFLWLGGYSNSSCTFNNSDDWVRSHVKSVAGHPGVGAYFVDDEPDPDACPTAPAQIAARSALVKSLDPGPPTLVVIERLERLKLFAGTVDVIGLDRYPCSYKNGCDYSKIHAQADEADRLGIRYWGVLQAYADDWYRLPTPDEMHQQFEHWRSTNMEGYLVFAWRYPDDSPSTWLANDSALQAQLAIENAR
jgi:hypothetical protein